MLLLLLMHGGEEEGALGVMILTSTGRAAPGRREERGELT